MESQPPMEPAPKSAPCLHPPPSPRAAPDLGDGAAPPTATTESDGSVDERAEAADTEGAGTKATESEAAARAALEDANKEAEEARLAQQIADKEAAEAEAAEAARDKELQDVADVEAALVATREISRAAELGNDAFLKAQSKAQVAQLEVQLAVEQAEANEAVEVAQHEALQAAAAQAAAEREAAEAAAAREAAEAAHGKAQEDAKLAVRCCPVASPQLRQYMRTEDLVGSRSHTGACHRRKSSSSSWRCRWSSPGGPRSEPQRA